MMKLYFMPGACSLAPHIILHELGLGHSLIRVSREDKRTEEGGDFLQINPKGTVPALQFADGRVLTETAAILQYLADTHAESGLAPAAGSFERAKLQEWLNYIAAEIHKSYGALFAPAAMAAEKQAAAEKLGKRLRYAENQLEKTPYITGARFSVADAYLYTVLRWAALVSFSLAPFPALRHYMEKLAARPSIIAAQKDEGIA